MQKGPSGDQQGGQLSLSGTGSERRKDERKRVDSKDSHPPLPALPPLLPAQPHIGASDTGCWEVMPDAGAQGLCWAMSSAGSRPRLPARSAAQRRSASNSSLFFQFHLAYHTCFITGQYH